MPRTTHFGRNAQKKKDMDPSHSGNTSQAHPYLMVSMTPSNPPPQIPEELRSSIDIEAFMNQLGHATIVNAIIDQNKETIITNVLRDNVGVFEFGRPPPIDITDLNHLLFGWQPPQVEPANQNIPSTQVPILIPQNTHPTPTQPLVHTTSQPTLSVPSASIATTHFSNPSNPPFASNNTTFLLPPQITSSPSVAHILLPGFNTSSSIPPNITIN